MLASLREAQEGGDLCRLKVAQQPVRWVQAVAIQPGEAAFRRGRARKALAAEAGLLELGRRWEAPAHRPPLLAAPLARRRQSLRRHPLM